MGRVFFPSQCHDTVPRGTPSFTLATSAGKYMEFKRDNTYDAHLEDGWIPQPFLFNSLTSILIYITECNLGNVRNRL